jgi:hypothetical protein
MCAPFSLKQSTMFILVLLRFGKNVINHSRLFQIRTIYENLTF